MNQSETLLETNKYSKKLCYYTRLTSLIQTWKQPVLITDLKQDPVISFGHRGQINSVVSETTGCKGYFRFVFGSQGEQDRRANYKNNTGMCD